MVDPLEPFTRREVSEEDRERMQFVISEMVNNADIPFLSVRQVYKILDAIFCTEGHASMNGDTEEFMLSARVWKRGSTNEWVLEIEGTINDTHVSCRHTEPATATPEDVPGLPSLYAAVEPDDEMEAAIVKLKWLEAYYRRNGWTYPIDDFHSARRVLEIAQKKDIETHHAG